MSIQREQANSLVARKDLIEAELSTQFSILKSHSADLHTPLVDPDGFPRADLDIYAVRNARVRIIELRNDHADIMRDIGKALEGVYDPALSNGDGEVELEPFAKVDDVASGSPASEAGLQKGDLVVKFGHLLKKSFTSTSLQPIADLVGQSENRLLPIKVLRSGQSKVLSLTPRKGWGGRGMLGCHIIPHTQQ